MEKHQRTLRLATIALLSALHIGFGLYSGQMLLLICGTGGMAYTVVAVAKRRSSTGVAPGQCEVAQA